MIVMPTQTTELVDTLTRALTDNRVQSNAERAERSDMVPIVLNPGQSSSIGNERFGPGEVIRVSEHQAQRLTSPRRGRSMPAARYLDEPEPDVRGNFPQPHGPGAYHPDSKHHRQPSREPRPKAGAGEKVINGEVIETGVPSDDDRAAELAEHGSDDAASSSLASASEPSNQGGTAPRPAASGGQGGNQGGSKGKDKGGNPGGQQGGKQGGSGTSSTPPSAAVGDGGKSGS